MEEITAVDLFAGAGGTSTGLSLACKELSKTPSLTAINHWQRAIETHALNHPWATHICADIGTINPSEIIKSGKLSILVASPECTFFSRARGGKPILDQKRTPAWYVLKWLEALNVDSLLVENVAEFQNWGPLNAEQHPIKEKKGEIFQAWIQGIRSLGYTVEYRVLNSADYGDATSRRRLFILGKKGNQKLNWPEASRSKTGEDGKKKWRGAKEVIDWSLPGESIFSRKKPLCANTIKRIMEGLDKFCTDEMRPFLVLMEHSGVHAAGNGTMSVDSPLPTISTTKGGAIGVASPFLVLTEHGTVGRWGRPVKSIDDPLPTITTKGAMGIASPFILPNEGIYRKNKPKSIDEPMATITQRGGGSLVQPFIIPKESGKTKSIDDPVGAITTRGGGTLVEPFIIPNFGRRKNQKPRIYKISDPLPTITGRGAGNLVQAFILSQDGRGAPRSTEEPMPTILTGGAHQIVQSFLTTYYGHGSTSSVDEPTPTITTRDRIGLVQPVINGYTFDIRFRMLTPKELAGAMGFPESYIFRGTRTEVVKQIGNAVAVNMAKALCMSLLR